MGKSAHRRARHDHADRFRLQSGWRDLPGLPGELCARWQRGLDAGRSLSHPTGQMGGSHPQALESDLIAAAAPARFIPIRRTLVSYSARPRGSGDPDLGRVLGPWIPACAGMSGDWFNGGATWQSELLVGDV